MFMAKLGTKGLIALFIMYNFQRGTLPSFAGLSVFSKLYDLFLVLAYIRYLLLTNGE